MNLLLKSQFGSHVYGTNLPTSDLDYKGIYLPSSQDILLQNVKDSINLNTKTGNDKNKADDVDYEIFSLQKYLALLMEGQTVSIDLLHTPEKFILEKNHIWDEIVNNKQRFLHSGVSSFAGYCRTQANKYGIKGSRMRDLKDALDFVETEAGALKDLKLREVINLEKLKSFVHNREHLQVLTEVGKNGVSDTYFEVLGRKYSLHLTVKHFLERINIIWDNYGNRARQAMSNEGIDWKALMHAVRVQEEAKELLLTGSITFPRPEVDLLLKIRKGELPYAQVAEIIENGLIELEQVQLKSILPKTPDYQFAKDLVEYHYREVVFKEHIEVMEEAMHAASKKMGW